MDAHWMYNYSYILKPKLADFRTLRIHQYEWFLHCAGGAQTNFLIHGLFKALACRDLAMGLDICFTPR